MVGVAAVVPGILKANLWQIISQITSPIPHFNQNLYKCHITYICLHLMAKKSSYRRQSHSVLDSAILTPENNQYQIPSCIFSKDISSFESIVKFLKEGYDLNLQSIATLLSKSRQSVWRAYNRASTTHPDSFQLSDLHYTIPLEIFKQQIPLNETLVSFLIEHYKLTFSEVAALLQRDQRTVWTLYHRAIKRNKIQHAKK